jgi:protein-arginine kinase activator protein McsA
MTPEEIKKALEEAVNKEDYETAAMLRDKMKEMKE